MKCPVCKEAQMVMTERQNIEIDYCPQCRGVWLDRDELDKLSERSERESIAASPQPAAGGYPRRDGRYEENRFGHHGSKHGSEHGSFLKRLFD